MYRAVRRREYQPVTPYTTFRKRHPKVAPLWVCFYHFSPISWLKINWLILSISFVSRPQTHSRLNRPPARNAFPGVCSSMSLTFSWQPVRRESIVHSSLRLSRPQCAKAVWSTSRSASLDGSTPRTFQRSCPALSSTALVSLVSPPTERRSQSRSANPFKLSRRKPGLLLCHFLAGFPRWWVGDFFRATHHTNNPWPLNFANFRRAIAACASFYAFIPTPDRVFCFCWHDPTVYILEGWVELAVTGRTFKKHTGQAQANHETDTLWFCSVGVTRVQENNQPLRG